MREWREGANRRRNERQTKVPSIRPPGESTKDTKKWCRGKIGREHKPVCMDYDDLKRTTYFKDWKVLVCDTCRKELDHFFPSPFHGTKRTPPAWVTPTDPGSAT